MQKHFPIFLASLILGIIMQLGIATHFCGGELSQAKMVYGYGKARCGMHCSIPASNTSQQEPIFQKLSCCQDFIFTISVDEYQTVSQKIIFSAHQNTHPGENHILTPDFFFINTPYTSIPPPHTTEVLLPFIQVFLI